MCLRPKVVRLFLKRHVAVCCCSEELVVPFLEECHKEFRLTLLGGSLGQKLGHYVVGVRMRCLLGRRVSHFCPLSGAKRCIVLILTAAVPDQVW